MAARPLLALCLAVVAFAGCTGNGLGGATASNNPGSFSLSAGGVANGSQTWDWQNPGSVARIAYSGGGAGTLAVSILDAAGHGVFSATFGGSGGASDSRVSNTGTPGTWKITVTANGAGGFNLQINQA